MYRHASGLTKSWIVPAQHTETILDRYLKTADLIERRVAIAANKQNVAITAWTSADTVVRRNVIKCGDAATRVRVADTIALINEQCVDFVSVRVGRL